MKDHTPILLVLDTNVVLDLLVFADPAVESLRQALLDKEATWLSSVEMKEELMRVLGYPRVAPRLAGRGLSVSDVLAEFDRFTCVVDAPPKTSCLCADADDQHFVDLAIQHGALLLSKDAAVLALRKRMSTLGARVSSVWPCMSPSDSCSRS